MIFENVSGNRFLSSLHDFFFLLFFFFLFYFTLAQTLFFFVLLLESSQKCLEPRPCPRARQENFLILNQLIGIERAADRAVLVDGSLLINKQETNLFRIVNYFYLFHTDRRRRCCLCTDKEGLNVELFGTSERSKRSKRVSEKRCFRDMLLDDDEGEEAKN